MSKPGELANANNIGEALLRALGLWENDRAITRVVIDVQAKELVHVTVTEEIRVETAEEFVEKISEFKLVPKGEPE